MASFSIVVALSQTNNGIGKNGRLPWKLKKDMQHFRDLTTFCDKEGMQNAVIMGRKTWESIPKRPLKARRSFVISHTLDNLPADVVQCSSLRDALERARGMEEIDQIFVIGGERVFVEALKMPGCEKLYVTSIFKDMECDVFFPAIDASTFKLVAECEGEEDGLEFCFQQFNHV